MDEYKKKIKIQFEVDKKSEQDLQNSLEKISKMDKFKKDFGKGFSSSMKDTFVRSGEDFGKGFGNAFIAIGKKFVDTVKNMFKNAWEEMNNMISYSTLSSSRTRELAFTYGFSGSQAYGFDKSMSMLGFSSEEDLMFAQPYEQEKFREIMTKYAERYEELADSGFFEDYREFQYEMEEFKQDITMEVVKFFMDNKQEIKEVMKVIMKTAEFIISSLSWLVKFFGGGRKEDSSYTSSLTTDIITNYGGNKSTNVKIDNTFNNVAKEDQTWLANAGSMTYEQVITALQEG